MKTLEKNINFIVCSQAEVYVSVELPLPYAATWQAVAQSCRDCTGSPSPFALHCKRTPCKHSPCNSIAQCQLHHTHKWLSVPSSSLAAHVFFLLASQAQDKSLKVHPLFWFNGFDLWMRKNQNQDVPLGVCLMRDQLAGEEGEDTRSQGRGRHRVFLPQSTRWQWLGGRLGYGVCVCEREIIRRPFFHGTVYLCNALELSQNCFILTANLW